MLTEVTLKKSQVIDSFRDLPEEVTADELIEKIILIRAIHERMQEAEQTPGIPNDVVMLELNHLKAQKLASKQSQ